jgi:serralysin
MTKHLIGGDGNDYLVGVEGSTMEGGLGNDTYDVRWGHPLLLDSGGIDWVVAGADGWTLGSGFENLRLSTETLSGGGRMVGNELDNEITAESEWEGHLEGLAGNDTLFGADGESTLLGGSGNDVLQATPFNAGGNTWLEGGTGQDQLHAGVGADSFVFRETPANSNFDRVYGFESGADSLNFDAAAYAALGALGDFSAGDDRFHAAAGARSGVDAEDRIIYNTSTGQLWYDADGSGSGGQMFIASLQGAPSLAASDIAVI